VPTQATDPSHLDKRERKEGRKKKLIILFILFGGGFVGFVFCNISLSLSSSSLSSSSSLLSLLSSPSPLLPCSHSHRLFYVFLVEIFFFSALGHSHILYNASHLTTTPSPFPQTPQTCTYPRKHRKKRDRNMQTQKKRDRDARDKFELKLICLTLSSLSLLCLCFFSLVHFAGSPRVVETLPSGRAFSTSQIAQQRSWRRCKSEMPRLVV